MVHAKLLTVLLLLASSVAAQSGNLPGPIGVAATERSFVDANGNPFFWLGDTVWQLFTSYTHTDATALLDDRRAKGFTVIQAVLCLWPGDTCAPNPSGERPFRNGDPATPNGAFFENVDWIVEAAAERGIVMALVPAWGASYIHSDAARLVTAANARAYGRYLGERYKERSNIVWLLGGDTAVFDDSQVYRELAAGIRETDAQRKMIGYHPGSTSIWPEWSIGATSDQSMNPYAIPETVLGFNMAQSYKWIDQIPLLMSLMYAATPAKPAVLGEGSYEGGHVDVRCCSSYPPIDAWGVRKQAYWAYLGGGSYTYGHDAIWSHGEFPGGGGWQEALNAPGAQHMSVLSNFFATQPWWDLVPANSMIVDGAGAGLWQNAAASYRNGSGALVYLAKAEPVTLGLAAIRAGTAVRATWMDPRSGALTDAGQYPKTVQTFTPPPGFEDAVLVLHGLNPVTRLRQPVPRRRE